MDTFKKIFGKEYVKVKLALLWVFVMFNYVYADILTLMDSAVLSDLLKGYAGSVQITQGFLLAGAVMILFNWRPRLGAWMIVIFLIPVTFAVHGYQMIYADSEAMRAIQQASFIKGFSLIGAALLITQIGVTHRPASTV